MSQTRGSKVTVSCANKSCRTEFEARIADRKRGWARYCSKSCKAIAQERRTGQYAEFVNGHGRGGSFIAGAVEDGK